MSGILAAGAIASVVSNRRRDSAAAAAVSGGGSEGLTFKAMATMEGAREASSAPVNSSGVHNTSTQLEFEQQQQQRQHETDSGESFFAQSSVVAALEAGDGGQAAEEIYFSAVETSSEVAAASPADGAPVLESDGEDAMAQVAVPKGSTDVEGHAGLGDEVDVEETAPLRGGWEDHDEDRGVDGATCESQETGL